MLRPVFLFKRLSRSETRRTSGSGSRAGALRSAAGLPRAHALRPTAAPERQRVCQLQRPVDQRRRVQLGRVPIASRITWAGRRVSSLVGARATLFPCNARALLIVDDAQMLRPDKQM